MWTLFLRSRYAPLLTHGSLVLLTASLFLLLYRLPVWVAFLPAAIIQHRIGVLLHEYIHGIPCSRYRTNLAVLSAWDGMLLLFGFVDLFRGTHLAHHRWLNREGDPAFQTSNAVGRSRLSKAAALEGIQHVLYLFQACRGRQPYVIPSRIVLGALLSTVWAGWWIHVGRVDIVVALLALTAFNTSIPISFRGAVEHHSYNGDPAFANEYRVLIPLFNLNKHIHHHEEPRCPWYLLEYRTGRPLWTWHYCTHWLRVYVTRDYVLMRPPK